MEKIYVHYTTDRGLIYRIYKELKKPRDSKKKKPEEIGEGNEHFSKENWYRKRYRFKWLRDMKRGSGCLATGRYK